MPYKDKEKIKEYRQRNNYDIKLDNLNKNNINYKLAKDFISKLKR